MKRKAELFVTVCFLAFLAVGGAVTALRQPQDISFYENRALAAFPEFSPQSAGDGSFTTNLERYLEDHAALRDTLLKAQTRADLALRRPVVNEIVITPERLLPFLPPSAMTREDIAAQAEAMADNLKRINDTTAEYGGYYCYVAVPCQSSYFEDDYPWYLENHKERSALSVELLSRALEERGVNFLDIRAAFEELGHPDEYGSRADNHYTMAGAFETYRLVMEKAAGDTGLDFPILGPEDVTFETLPGEYLGSRERRLMGQASREEALSILHPAENVPFTRTDNGAPIEYGVYATQYLPLTYNLYMGGDIANTVIDTHRDELPSILIYGDSFTNALECVAYLSFDEMHSLDLRYYDKMSLEDYIRELQPELVVCIRDYDAMLLQAGNGGGV